MRCFGIIWNTIQEYKEECIDLISQRAEILLMFQLNLGDLYDDFVNDLYPLDDDLTRDKILAKINSMKNKKLSNDITVLILNVKPEELEYQEGKKKFVFKGIHRLKLFIREYYMNKIDNYYSDNVFHLSDNINEFEYNYKVFLKYYKLINGQQRIKKYGEE